LGDGLIAEGGGQWIGPTQTEILKLCGELGIDTFPTHTEGDLLFPFWIFNIPVTYSSEPPGPLHATLDKLSTTVPLDSPWTAPQAAEWDTISLADWMAAQDLSADEEDMLRTAAGLTLGTTVDQLSFLYFLYYLHAGGGLHMLESIRGGAQDSRIAGGAQRISLKLAEQSQILLDHPVRAIRQGPDQVVVETAHTSFTARRVILAVMPGSCTQIVFDPPLPELRERLNHHWVQRQGATKVSVAYPTTFWRDKDLNGMVLGHEQLPFVVDNSQPDNKGGVLMALGPQLAPELDFEGRKAAVIDALVDLFGDAARNYSGYDEMDWGQEQFTAGCVSPLPPGILTRYGPGLRPPFRRLHWAGTEVATVWTGYMEGAVRSGYSAAAEVARTFYQADEGPRSSGFLDRNWTDTGRQRVSSN
jgi:monoamine oxidase